ncbi:hypothetical protein B0H17DRAFT_1202835 [Mycena rosella]|uniref:Uncharacterized protein n=1 Tax=Mycena rosella TaxID=1033263 RepID=A0AAD7DDA2_MYCRO|nr:hypothetical protein B0H17DRAFT_1202835 [Mycena rosella]
MSLLSLREVLRQNAPLDDIERGAAERVGEVGRACMRRGVAKALVAAGQWDRALGVVEDMERMWDGPPASEASTPTPPMTRSSSQAKLH